MDHEVLADQEPTGVGWNFTEEKSSCGPGRTMTYPKEASLADENIAVCSAAEQAEAEFDATAYETRPSSPPPKQSVNLSDDGSGVMSREIEVARRRTKTATEDLDSEYEINRCAR